MNEEKKPGKKEEILKSVAPNSDDYDSGTLKKYIKSTIEPEKS